MCHRTWFNYMIFPAVSLRLVGEFPISFFDETGEYIKYKPFLQLAWTLPNTVGGWKISLPWKWAIFRVSTGPTVLWEGTSKLSCWGSNCQNSCISTTVITCHHYKSSCLLDHQTPTNIEKNHPQLMDAARPKPDAEQWGFPKMVSY